jgi:hypothetical protein
MKVYMFDEDVFEYQRSQDTLPAVKIIRLIVVSSFLFFVPMLLSLLLMMLFSFVLPIIIVILLYALLLAIIVKLFCKFLGELQTQKNACLTAFVEDNNTLWAVRLISIPSSAPDSVAAITAPGTEEPQVQTVPIKELIFPEHYIQALINARSSTRISKDLNKNFKFIFNDSVKVIRLDDVAFVKETKTTEVYSYKNYMGKTVTLDVFKAYPGLREAVLNSKPVRHFSPFPRLYE